MRFSLRTLLLLFPALIVSYALAYGCVILTEIWQRPTCGGSMCTDERNNVRSMQLDMDHDMPAMKLTATLSVLNDYLQGQAPLPKILARHLSWNHVDGGDFWGNPYRCVLRETADAESASMSPVTRLHFYSCGQDGISRSDGNDEDDINSWSDHSREFYAEVTRRQEAQRLRYEAMFYFPWTCGAVIAGWLFLRRLYS